jgi:hypothetical protein
VPTPARDFSGARALADLSLEDCAWLATQQGFAGRLAFDGTHFEWQRSIDLQPASVHADAGSLHWDADVLVERGRDVAYLEHWHRDAVCAAPPVGALAMRERTAQAMAIMVRVGAFFMFARDRSVAVPMHRTLSACVAAAPSCECARHLIDCEISFGQVQQGAFRITASSLPFRIGDSLDPRLEQGGMSTADRAYHGNAIVRHWQVLEHEGELDAVAAAPRMPA